MRSDIIGKILSVILLCMTCTTAHAQLVINELMQSNIDLIMDDMNEFPDSWVEVYNSGKQAVNLRDYQIGLSDDVSKAWQLPDQNVSAGAYTVIYCDKACSGRHTDFRLDSGKGGSVYLFVNGKVTDKVTKLAKQPAPNIAYGRKEKGSEEWGYMCNPTPFAPNMGGIAKGMLGEPLFSHDGGVMPANADFQLTLSVPDNMPEGTVIRYTTDGSEPTTISKLYQTPIDITATTVVRAKLFCSDWLSPRSTVRSYIRHGRQLTLPVVSLVTNSKYLYDKNIGIYSDARQNDGRLNYEHDWRRPMNIEMYEADGTTCVLNQLVEARIQGGATRSASLKSMAVYANKRFGEKRLAYEFFPDQRPGVKNFKSIILRNAGNDFDYLYMRDAIIQRTLAANCDLDWQAWRPVIIYINGTYRGILNVRERSNEDNIFTNYDELEDIDMIENWWELKTGTWDNFNAFRNFYTEHNHTMAEYDKWMDTQEFINLMAGNIFYCNLDFPGNNIVIWRPRAEGGRWRFIMKDTDFGLGLFDRDVNYNMLKWLHDPNHDPSTAWANQYDHTRLFRRLEEDATFQRRFIDCCTVYMGDFMNERGTRQQWDAMYGMISKEYPYHRELINRWWPNYNDEMRKAQTWLSRRVDVFYKQLADYYHLGTPTPLTICASDSTDAGIMVNGIGLSSGRFDGRYYQGRQLSLSSVDGHNSKIVGWEITEVKNGKSTRTIVNEPSYKLTMPQVSSLRIEAITEAVDGIMELPADSAPRYTKHIRNGKIVIIHNGKEYSLSGVEVQQ